jgi:hypothetical protein
MVSTVMSKDGWQVRMWNAYAIRCGSTVSSNIDGAIKSVKSDSTNLDAQIDQFRNFLIDLH